jgi:hypothetical protein
MVTAKAYKPTSRLIVKATAPVFPFKLTKPNHRNRIWLGLVSYFAEHQDGMTVADFRVMARRTAHGVKGDMDIDLYVDHGLIEIVGQ